MPRQSKSYSVLSDAALGSLSQLGGRLKEARLRRNWSQQQTAEKAGLSESSIKKVEGGQPEDHRRCLSFAAGCVSACPTALDRVLSPGSDSLGEALARSATRRRAGAPPQACCRQRGVGNLMAEKLFVHVDLGAGEKVLAGANCWWMSSAGGSNTPGRSSSGTTPFHSILSNLPLNSEVHENPRTRETPGVFGVLIDAGPDEWGRRQLSKTRQPPPVTDVEFLLAASGEGVGALHFTAEIRDTPKPTPKRPFEKPDPPAENCRRHRGRPGGRPEPRAFLFSWQRPGRCPAEDADRSRG